MMSAENGVIRIGHKGRKKFAFGDDGVPFEVDVVVAFREWVAVDDHFRGEDRTIPDSKMAQYHQAALDFVSKLAGNPMLAFTVGGITVAEALDLLARLREQYDEVAVFFQPRLRGEPESQGSSGSEISFSEEAS
jgi:hypothetical protein